jgi:hypothetical protein
MGGVTRQHMKTIILLNDRCQHVNGSVEMRKHLYTIGKTNYSAHFVMLIVFIYHSLESQCPRMFIPNLFMWLLYVPKEES